MALALVVIEKSKKQNSKSVGTFSRKIRLLTNYFGFLFNPEGPLKISFYQKISRPLFYQTVKKSSRLLLNWLWKFEINLLGHKIAKVYVQLIFARFDQ
jgi:hypothetical protein